MFLWWVTLVTIIIELEVFHVLVVGAPSSMVMVTNVTNHKNMKHS
jgi:tetrahydromethanopterin S-methyltransferase subunit D